eukprot:TRINITY_DN6497_c0_g1_i2.p1 TRINITY_DN6497_c0_g1~~TRINITY_DN6497_c0_g1_i2.p1  ORF type:complete len:288 (+),score=40.16 TRINITY_DN6497_c0_g1_i2:415-1278(+)
MHQDRGTFEKAMEWEQLLQQYEACRRQGVRLMVGLSVHQERAGTEKDIGNGILSDHEYSMIRLIDTDGQLPLLCVLRNPWGDKEWRGAYSDGDTRAWSRRARELTGYDPTDRDGEFVMTYEDAVSVFDMAEISMLFPPSFFRSKVDGAWRGSSAAGCGNIGGQTAYLSNPQFLLEVPEPPRLGMSCFGTLVLTQEDVRYSQAHRKEYSIAFTVYRTSDGQRMRSLHSPGVDTGISTGSHTNRRAVSCDLSNIEPGQYIIIPSTFRPGEECSFYFTTWVSYPVHLHKL